MSLCASINYESRERSKGQKQSPKVANRDFTSEFDLREMYWFQFGFLGFGNHPQSVEIWSVLVDVFFKVLDGGLDQ